MLGSYRNKRRQIGQASACKKATSTRALRLRRLARASLRRGAAVTEFAIVAPVFFLMVIGFIEFGRALMVQQVLINASRVGARQASITGATTAQVQAAVQAYTSGISINGVIVTVTPDPAAAIAGTAITVKTT